MQITQKKGEEENGVIAKLPGASASSVRSSDSVAARIRDSQMKKTQNFYLSLQILSALKDGCRHGLQTDFNADTYISKNKRGDFRGKSQFDSSTIDEH